MSHHTCTQGNAIYNLATITIGSVSFVNNGGDQTGDQTIYNAGKIIWICQLGHYQRREGHFDGDFDSCSLNPCPSGFYGNTTDLTDLRCSGLCTTGHYCDHPATITPIPCPPGTVFAAVGAQDLSNCNRCFPGQYQEGAGQTACSACSRGTFSASYGSTACDSCPTGGYCADAAAGSLALAFTPCGPGTYNNLRGQQSADGCTPCPPGTASSLPSRSSLAACLPCDPGFQASDPGQPSCTICTPGTFRGGDELLPLLKEPSSGSGEYLLAEPGSGESLDADRQASCQNCTAGSYCPAASVSPTGG